VALNAFECNHLTSLGLKRLERVYRPRGKTGTNANTQDRFQSKVRHPRMCVFSYVRMSRFLVLWPWHCPMTLTHEVDLDILNMYPHTKVEFLGQGFQKMEHEQTDTHTDSQRDRHTDKRDRTHYQPQTRAVESIEGTRYDISGVMHNAAKCLCIVCYEGKTSILCAKQSTKYVTWPSEIQCMKGLV